MILLIVEDDASLRELIQATAEHTGEFGLVVAAANGRLALDHIHRALASPEGQVPDFILSDLSMPQMDGIELITTLKQADATKHIPVAVMTSSDLPNDRERATAAGCSAFFTKPIRLDELATLIRSIPRICGPAAVVSAAHPAHSD